MSKIIKLFSLLGVLLVGFSVFVSVGTSAYAAETTEEVSQETRDKLATELAFYFETVGFIGDDGEYHIKDLHAIHELASQDTEQGQAAKIFYENVIVPRMERKDWKKYAACVAINSLPGGGVAWAIGTQSGFIEALKAFNFEKAADMLIDIAEKQLGKAAAKELSKINIVAGIATSAVSCALE